MSDMFINNQPVWVLDTVYSPFFNSELTDLSGDEVWEDQLVAFQINTENTICTTELFNSKHKEIFKDALVVTCEGSLMLSVLIDNGWALPKEVIDIQVEHSLLSNGVVDKKDCSVYHIAEDFGYRSRELDFMLYDRSPYAASNAICTVFYELIQTYNINVKQAMQRGRYIKALAQLQENGIPIDLHRYCLLPSKQQVINHYSTEFDIFSGTSVSGHLLAKYCKAHKIKLEKSLTSKDHISSKELKLLAHTNPKLEQIYHISCLLQGGNNKHLKTDPDTYRNIAPLNPFGTTTGRNKPKSSEFIYGHPKWMHSFIKPEEGTSIAYIDWNQQEFGIAASLSSDTKMLEAYKSGDPYLQFAIDIGALPASATKNEYKKERDYYKKALLAIQYGIGSKSLGELISVSENEAKHLIKQFESCYRTYAYWCFRQINQALFCGEVRTPFGWNRKINSDTSENSIKNFPIQAYGAELMRYATCLLVESGIKVCTSVHDAFLIESPTTDIHEAVKKTKELMAQACRQVLDGFELTTDDEIISYPHRLSNDDQESIWNAAIPVIRGLGNE